MRFIEHLLYFSFTEGLIYSVNGFSQSGFIYNVIKKLLNINIRTDISGCKYCIFIY
jgi:hypothetical protein